MTCPCLDPAVHLGVYSQSDADTAHALLDTAAAVGRAFEDGRDASPEIAAYNAVSERAGTLERVTSLVRHHREFADHHAAGTGGAR